MQWRLKNLPDGPTPAVQGNRFSQIPEAIYRVLAARGINSDEALQCFLEPPHRLPYCPMRLSGMESALRRLKQEIPDNGSGPAQGGRIGIVGDFDVDGITGTAILMEGLAGLGIPTAPYLPDRVSEGHGLSTESVRYLAEQGASLIITVDCGVSSVAEAALARQMGMDVIITDHHSPPPRPPEVAAIINPRVPGNEYPFLHLCGAGLAFKLMEGLYKLLGKPLPGSLLELVALGTIADVVPLIDENRFLVREGLKALENTSRPGLKELYRISGLEGKPINAESVAFQLVPRLNSSGRMGHARDSLKLLTTADPDEAGDLARQLETQNRHRQELTRQLYASAQAYVDGLEELPPFILFSDPTVTPGVAGLVASRLTERYRRPSVALAPMENGTWVGSGRSMPAFNLIEAFNECADLFLRHGGHARAAGFSIAGEMLPELERRLCQVAVVKLDGADLQPALEYDDQLKLADISEELLSWLGRLEPFGEANPKPLFMTPNLPVKRAWHIGSQGQHLKLLVGEGRRSMPVLAFNRSDKWQDSTERIDLVYSIGVDYWQGKRQVNLVAEDFRPHQS